MTTYEKIMAFAKAVPELCNFQGDAVDARIYRALGTNSRTYMYWKESDFENIRRTDINALLHLLKCTYEDVFL
jgi:hypothetical protein